MMVDAWSYSSSIFHNNPLISAVIAFVLAQSTKFFTSWYKDKRWDARQFVASGGMPSSHSATVTALAVATGLQDGFGGSAFAIAVILATVVMYDAFGIRLHAGKQAEASGLFLSALLDVVLAFGLRVAVLLVLNQIVCELPEDHPLADTRPLRELLGHTLLQVVAGAILGLITSTAAHLICGITSQTAQK